MTPKEIHVVPHMHWDREWYFSTEESQVLLVNNMDEIMAMLEQNPDYPAYVLDGQTAILEDYFAAKPENYNRVKRLVQTGRLKVGPWYTQTDEAIVGAESMTRNLLYGIKDSRKLGEPMMIGYVPDSFGQSAQAPMILNQFGIKRSLFWRGFSPLKGTNSSEFRWRSQDGSEVFAENFPLGYAIGKYLEDDAEILKPRMDKILETLDARANGNDELLPNGHDQMPIQQNIQAVIQLLNRLYPGRHFSLSTYEQLFDELEKQQNVPIVEGEMLDGQYARVHRSIYSTRMDLKVYNTRIENKITNILEPLASLAQHFGIPYQHGLIELIWKELMKNHAHDSIGGCVSDKVNREIWGRYLVAEERVDMLIEFYKRKLTEAVKADGVSDKLTLFNLLPGRRERPVEATITTKASGFTLKDAEGKEIPFTVIQRGTIDAGIIDRQIVAGGDYEPFNQFTIEFNWIHENVGYETLTIHPITQELPVSGKKVTRVETAAYDITFKQNGTLTILDKDSDQTYRNVLNVENQADDGDEYDFSPLRGDKPVYSADLVNNAKIEITEFAQSYRATIEYTLSLPKSLAERGKKEPQLDTLAIKFNLVISKSSRTIEITADLDNHIKDQRTRVLFPTNLISKQSIADNQFGKIHRPVHDPAMAVWENQKWDERPDAIFPLLSYVSLTGAQTVSVLTDSSREYEIIGNDDTIALTLVRGVDWLGKSDLVRRPGRPSGIHAPTPDGEVLGELSLDFALRIDPVPFSQAGVAQSAKQYLTPVVAYNQIPFEAMHMNPPMVSLSSKGDLNLPLVKGAVQSTIKLCEDNERLLLRIFNPSDEALSLPAGIQQFDLAESPLPFAEKLLPNQVVTLGLEK
ncbi:glycoside hydrolase family 38 C-terminal domain-containing protein [Schleiferilactobacillus perolens]|uniref:glycoside hydrolase family 38 N-terminal domain-containing protein n=1 Tax=Schleiferilactobacillus perolens TaxID=100468 RepID=UPI00235738F5|nr:glycoside hydrolase family 38 C-terminal domain-containing protein [Schleiferilactobacillus perolens]MCI2170053.1 alpha-mannosidase [Schleiferilactobacillus perolens]